MVSLPCDPAVVPPRCPRGIEEVLSMVPAPVLAPRLRVRHAWSCQVQLSAGKRRNKINIERIRHYLYKMILQLPKNVL